MSTTFQRLTAAAAVTAALGATAMPASADVVLTFSKIFDIDSSITYTGTDLGDITVTPQGGKLVIKLGAIGVTGGGLFNLDPSINARQSITFNFEGDVALKYWDLDDYFAPDHHDTNESFALTVTPSVGAAALLTPGLHTHSLGTDPVGKSFTFGWTHDNYMIDTLVFDSATVVSQVPEPGTYALLLAGLAVAGLLVVRRRA